jgi:regulator of CtrA degradation
MHRTWNARKDKRADVIDFGEKFAASALFEALFREGMGLVEDTAAYLDGPGRRDSQLLDRNNALIYARESMRLTTRLMQMASWLLLQRAVGEGEISAEDSLNKKNRVVFEISTAMEPASRQSLPDGLVELIDHGMKIYDRVRRLDAMLTQNSHDDTVQPNSPSRQLDMLKSAFGSQTQL